MSDLKTDLSAYNNDWYRPGGGLKRAVWYFVNIFFFKSSLFPFYGLKASLLRIFGATIGKGVLIKPNVNIKYPWLLKIADHVWIGEGVWIDNLAEVAIGSNACISQGALILCGNHDYTDTKFGLIVSPVVLEDGVWIGANSIVPGGTVCESHSVLAAGSVSRGVLESYTIYRGNPAVRVRERAIIK